MEAPTQTEPSREGRKRTKLVDRLVQEAQEKVGALSSSCRERRSLERYTGYMALMKKLIDSDPFSFEEVVSQQMWIDAMV